MISHKNCFNLAYFSAVGVWWKKKTRTHKMFEKCLNFHQNVMAKFLEFERADIHLFLWQRQMSTVKNSRNIWSCLLIFLSARSSSSVLPITRSSNFLKVWANICSASSNVLHSGSCSDIVCSLTSLSHNNSSFVSHDTRKITFHSAVKKNVKLSPKVIIFCQIDGTEKWMTVLPAVVTEWDARRREKKVKKFVCNSRVRVDLASSPFSWQKMKFVPSIFEHPHRINDDEEESRRIFLSFFRSFFNSKGWKSMKNYYWEKSEKILIKIKFKYCDSVGASCWIRISSRVKNSTVQH